MYNIKTYTPLNERVKKTFNQNYNIDGNLTDYDAIMVHSTNLHEENFSKDLKCVVRVGAGVNNIPVDKLTKEGIAVFNTPGGNSNAVKELTICALIGMSRNILKANAWTKSLTCDEKDLMPTIEKGKKEFKGNEIFGKTIGIVGVGNIGSRVARACHALGMKCFGYDPFLPNHIKEELKNVITFVNTVDEVLQDKDYVTLHSPVSKDNSKQLDKEIIDKMKDGVRILNFARGEIVDACALDEAIKSGKVAGYATDFPTRAELNNDKIFILPHLGASSVEADMNCAMMARDEVIEFLENGNVINSVNFPCISMERAEGDRITILHKNVVGMLGKITDQISNMNLNIENLTNKARGEIAYTILDFNVGVDESVIANLSNIPNVIKINHYTA